MTPTARRVLDEPHELGVVVRHGLVVRPRVARGRADVEVGVVVDDRQRQGVRQRGELGALAHEADSPRRRASSSSTTDGSSLVNTGVGGPTGVPATTGTDSQRGKPV